MSAPGTPKETADRWRRVEALYDEIRALPPDERTSALAAACSDDPELMAEVQSLLDQPGSAEEFLNSPALEVAARLASGAPSTLTGRRIGVFEVQGLLGVGGMGEVYRARDTRLGRSVAIKILPRAFKDDRERLVRFEREARMLAALSHPRICALYDVGRDGGTDYLVMELVEGETLAERLKQGPLALDQTLPIAIDIADALDKAHRQGIIHRDLKPGNVMLTKSGPKLMDFGLAKLSLAGKDAEVVSALPTASELLTGEGMLMGTVPYMAPEQLEGKGPDARSDLWALACVLYEMVTGRPAFEGKSRASLISSIMATSPEPIGQLQPLTPLGLQRLIKVCLAKDPDDRLQTAHDVMQELKWIAETPVCATAGTENGPGVESPRRRMRGALVGAIALLASVSLGVVLGRHLLTPTLPPAPTVRTILGVGPAEELNSGVLPPFPGYTLGGTTAALTWTPDGRSLVFVGRQAGVQRIYVRALDSEQARPLEGTEGAYLPTVSPDGKWVAFWAGGPTPTATGHIQRVAIAGGPPGTIIDGVAAPHGMAWGVDGRLFYGPAECGSGLMVICSATPEGGATAITKGTGAGSSQRHTLPHLLPDGQALLYTMRQRTSTWGDEEVVAHVFATGETKVLLKDAVDARYVGSGHLVFLRRGTLFGARFDLDRLEVIGTPIPILDAVSQALRGANTTNITGAGQFSVASTGALAWVRGEAVPYADTNIVSVDRRGRVRPLEERGRPYNVQLALSPDGRKLVVGRIAAGEESLWIYDLERGIHTKFQEEGENTWPRWSPDGQRIAFNSLNNGISRIVWRKADGTGALEALSEGGVPSSWSPDGRQFAFINNTGASEDTEIRIATLGSGTVTAEALIGASEKARSAEFSPDGKWIMYESDASGQYEVYVQPYPGPGPRQQVSLEGGINASWNPAGGEIFFLAPGTGGWQDMMSVHVRLDPTLSFGKPRRLFNFAPRGTPRCGPVRCYAVSPDGQLFYRVQSAAPLPQPPRPPVTQIQLVTNWAEELKARIAAGQAK